jgi:hypothetical protein
MDGKNEKTDQSQAEGVNTNVENPNSINEVQIDSINNEIRTILEKFNTAITTYFEKAAGNLDDKTIEAKDAIQRQQKEVIKVLQNEEEELVTYFRALNTQMKNIADEQQKLFKSKLEDQKIELAQDFETLHTQMKATADEQQKLFKSKLEALVDGLKNLSDTKERLSELEQQILRLITAIKKSAATQASCSIQLWIKIVGLVVGLASFIYLFDKFF